MNELKDLTAAKERLRTLTETGDHLLTRVLGLPVPNALEKFKEQKAAVGAITVTSLQPDLAPLNNSVNQRTILGQMQTSSGPIAAKLPALTTPPTAYWVGENLATPVTKADFSTAQLKPTKLAVMIAISREALKPNDGQSRNLVLRAATRAMVRAEDTALLSATAATADAPAGLLNGVTASGTVASAATLPADLLNLYNDVSGGEAERPVFIASGGSALWLLGSGMDAFQDAKLAGGGVAGAMLIVSPAATHKLILVDAAQIATYDGGLEVETSMNAAIEMSDDPSDGPASRVSAFQTNITVLRLLKFTNWQKLVADAVGFLELPDGSAP